ncbi:MAG: TIGR00341 family protein [Algoriphagus sp.]|uniref:TIGR00341 family protein n=1 Tax=Algoriphagus sp. TaxID=1872435 RepID=UPI0018493084|nr:TIGR00341 family protein [Algoriphagus sp.]NVJ85930.1 TIGR00341 family protein [Algoriphagus sp.]
MKNYHLFFDPNLDEGERKNFFEKLDPQPESIQILEELDWSSFSKDEFLLLWVNDIQGKEILKSYPEEGPKLIFLPHPELQLIARSIGVPVSKETAFKNFQDAEEVPQFDLLEINGKLCLNSLVIGDSLSVLYDTFGKGFFENLKERFARFFKLFKRVKLQKFRITYQSGEEEKVLETAAMGVLAVPHCESNLLFKRLIPQSGLDDSLIHIILVSPKSLLSIIYFGIKTLFFSIKSNTIPDFLSYISTSKISIETEEPIPFAIDGEEQQGSKIDLQLAEKNVRILSGFESQKTKETKQREINVQKLPKGTLLEALTGSHLPWVRHATTEEFKDLFTLLRQNAEASGSFLVLMALSTLIATFGLFGDSSPVVIGAMILAPLMGPIISLAMGVLRQDGSLVKNSLRTIFFGMLIGLFFAVLITWITPLKSLNSEIIARIRPNLLDLGVAVAAGIAGAYAHSREEIAKTLAGVAISVALVPPLAVVGIGLAWANWNVFWGAALLYGTNLAGIVLAAALTFLMLGYSPFRLATKGLLLSVIIFILVTAPLVLSFRNMVAENDLIQNLSGKEIPHGLMREVNVLEMSPLRLSVTILSEKELKESDYLEIKREIESVVGEPIELELTLGVKVFE